MDCPHCYQAMEPKISEKGGTIAWVCPTHGSFAVICVCGALEGGLHDRLTCPLDPDEDPYEEGDEPT